MGRIKKGILGGFSGTVGTVIGGNWKGIEYMRSKPTVSRGKSSLAQDVQKLKFSVATKFLRALRPLMSQTFKASGQETDANSALAYTLKNAMTGVYPDVQIDYRLALVSRGKLPNANQPQAANNGTNVEFTWTSNAGISNALANDKVILVAYHAASNHTYFTIGSAMRSAGAASLNLPGLEGETVETWIAFVSDNSKEVSNSLYTGKITLA